ncbi:peptidylprolyl isomerase [Levilactobacillus bambusae]|uniref:Peptidyl-prolyl cis-trans isomerase n=1 Tax=Levilactobacillus bambusae TaxID=2024736 RepID=A0A2V1MX25_9LACO|nr:peptidylprolyl isomerase [Levilactobacillus bambusae]PWF99620.1 peptidylprolyl isomerase [Levilactobacillus bambusae]
MAEYPQLSLAQQKGPKVTLKTTMGDVTIQLFPEQAPKTVENFVGLAKKNYYDGVIFHRIIPDFMIQGGDPTGTGMGGESLWGNTFEDEFSNELFNLRGALSMANAGPGTNGSQFFIVQNQNLDSRMVEQMKDAGYPDDIIEAYKQGGTPWLDHHHTVFGQVIDGMDVIDQMAKVKTDMSDKPEQDIVIESVDVED